MRKRRRRKPGPKPKPPKPKVSQKRYKTPKALEVQEAAVVRDCIVAMIVGMGIGGLTWMANKLGMSVSTLRRRLLKDHGCFDLVTMRAMLLIMENREEKLNYLQQFGKTENVGPYTIRVRYSTMYGEHVPTWEVTPGAETEPGTAEPKAAATVFGNFENT